MTKHKEKEEDIIKQKDMEKEIEKDLEEQAIGEKKKEYPEPIVGALIINQEGKILLAQSHKWKGLWTIFGGHVEMGEKLEDAVRREVKEETGLDVEVEAELGFSDSIFNKNFHAKKHFIFIDYLCRHKGENGKVKVNHEYKGEVNWFSLEEALKMDLADGTKLIIGEYQSYLNKKDYLDGWKRAKADFENYKKRQAQSQQEFFQFANVGLIMQILPVVDNFHASIGHIPEEQKKSPWVAGIMHIQKQLENILKDNGVSEIEVKIGDDFNPAEHEAVSGEQEKKELKNKITKVVQKGYKLGDKVIRAARVIVE